MKGHRKTERKVKKAGESQRELEGKEEDKTGERENVSALNSNAASKEGGWKIQEEKGCESSSQRVQP